MDEHARGGHVHSLASVRVRHDSKHRHGQAVLIAASILTDKRLAMLGRLGRAWKGLEGLGS